MIYIVNTPSNTVRPALVLSQRLALPIYDEPWGTSIPITNLEPTGLDRQSFIVLSQTWHTFRKKRHIGTLDVEDRHRLRRAVNTYKPALRSEMDTL
jgi:hypothetical protein